MILRHSINSIFRMKRRAALFLLLIIVLTTFIYLGVNTWISSENMMRMCNENYTTIASFTYMGAEYPDENVYDKSVIDAANAFDYSLITDSKYVKDWEATSRRVGICEDYVRTAGASPHIDSTVCLIYVMNNQNDGVSAVFDIPLFSKNSRTGKFMVNVSLPYGLVLEKNKAYIVHGEFFQGPTAYASMILTPFESAAAEAMGIKTEDIPVAVPLSDYGKWADFLKLEDNIYHQMADFYRSMDNEIVIWEIGNIKANELFHEGIISLKEGRLFTDKEIKSTSKVCLITEDIANKTGKGIGDTIDLLTVENTGLPLSDCYWPGMEGNKNESFEIIGVTTVAENMQNYMFVPNGGKGDAPSNFGYTFGQAVIENGRAEEFLASLEGKLPERLVVDIYDEGYAEIEESLKAIRTVSAIITIVSVIAGISVLILFGYLFVSKQSETLATMSFLGTKKGKITMYTLVGSGLIALVSAIVGALIGYFSSGKVVELAFELASKLNFIDTRYSNGAIGVEREFSIISKTSIGISILIGLAVFALGVISCLLFTLSILSSRGGNKKDSVSRRPAHIPRPPRSSSKMKGSAFKYAILSLMRGGMRSLVVPIISVAMVIFICTLTTTSLAYESALDNHYEASDISGRFTTYSGKGIGGVMASRYAVSNIYQSKYIENLELTVSEKYCFAGVSMKSADGSVYAPTVHIPSPASFSYETLQNKILRGSSLIFTNSLKTSPEFYYAWTDTMTAFLKTEFIAIFPVLFRQSL